MQTQKIQITLTPQEILALSLKGESLGYNVTKFIKFLITKEAYEMVESIRIFPMSEELEKKTLKAIEEHKKGKTKELRGVNDLDNL